MAQNSQPLDLAEALARLRATLPVQTAEETRRLTDAANLVLAQDIVAPVNLPPFPASAMDGYALRRADLNPSAPGSFRLIGVSRAGHPCDEVIGAGEAVRIFTGAAVPAGADQVMLQEDALEATEDRVAFAPITPGESYIRPIAHDVARGAVLARRGESITPFVHGTLAASGVTSVTVKSPLSVGVFSTGDELVEASIPPADLRPGQIYDSNRTTVLRLLEHVPCDLSNLGCLPDDPDKVREALLNASSTHDVLLTSGGVSVGDADFITDTIRDLGELNFWKLNLKPGKPLAVGRIGRCTLFGLPGNPVSTIVTLLLVAKPAIAFMSGANAAAPLRIQATLQNPLSHRAGRAEYQRGTLVAMAAGELQVSHTGDQSSNRLSSFANANCLIEIPGPSGDVPAGSSVTVLPFASLL